MADEVGKHNMNEGNVSTGFIQREAGDHVPPGMPVMALASFSGSNCGFDFKTDFLPPRGHMNQIRVSLMMIVLERRESGERIAQDIRNNSAEIISLNICRQRARGYLHQWRIDHTDHALGLIQRLLKVLHGQTTGKRGILYEKPALNLGWLSRAGIESLGNKRGDRCSE